MTATTTLQIERSFDAPAQAVFDAWTSEEVLRRWFHAEHDWETTQAEVDLRVGGVVRVVMRDPHRDVDYGGGGRFTEIDRPTRLAFTWIWDDNPTRTLIEVEFEALAPSIMSFHHGIACFDTLCRIRSGGLTGIGDFETTANGQQGKRQPKNLVRGGVSQNGWSPAPA